MVHNTSVSFIFDIFSQFSKASESPTNLRELKVTQIINQSLFEIPVYMDIKLVKQPIITKATSQLGNIFPHRH